MELNIETAEFERIAAEIHSDQSPVGIDARKTHVIIIHMLQQMETRLQRIEERLDQIPR